MQPVIADVGSCAVGIGGQIRIAGVDAAGIGRQVIIAQPSILKKWIDGNRALAWLAIDIIIFLIPENIVVNQTYVMPVVPDNPAPAEGNYVAVQFGVGVIIEVDSIAFGIDDGVVDNAATSRWSSYC